MAKTFFELDQNIRLIINQSPGLALQSTRIDGKTEKYILHTMNLVLGRYARLDLLDLSYTIVKELAINGIKANQKRIFFEEQGLDIHKDEDYEKGMLSFRGTVTERSQDIYGEKARIKGIYVKIYLTHNADGMCIEVENNTPITPTEERRMREKMKKSMSYNDIAEFYMDNMDNTEGAGLGLALIVILLKGAGLDPALFRILTKSDRTVARVEIPFSDQYVAKRVQAVST